MSDKRRCPATVINAEEDLLLKTIVFGQTLKLGQRHLFASLCFLKTNMAKSCYGERCQKVKNIAFSSTGNILSSI